MKAHNTPLPFLVCRNTVRGAPYVPLAAVAEEHHARAIARLLSTQTPAVYSILQHDKVTSTTLCIAEVARGTLLETAKVATTLYFEQWVRHVQPVAPGDTWDYAEASYDPDDGLPINLPLMFPLSAIGDVKREAHVWPALGTGVAGLLSAKED